MGITPSAANEAVRMDDTENRTRVRALGNVIFRRQEGREKLV